MSTERVTLLRHLLDQSEEENELFEQYRALVLRRWVDPQGLPENEQFLWGILQEAAVPDGKHSSARQKIGDYFASCMDEDAVARVPDQRRGREHARVPGSVRLQARSADGEGRSLPRVVRGAGRRWIK